MENKKPPQAGGSQQPAAGNGSAKAKTLYDRLFPPESPQRKFGPLIVAVLALVIFLLAKCTVSTVGEKITSASQARAVAERVRSTGVLVVKSNRPEAAVEAARIASAGDPAAEPVKGVLGQPLSGLTPGKYSVTLRADGWPDARGDADVTAGQQTEATVNFKSGSLRLESDPAGATVKRAGATLGKTPLVVPQLPPGEVQLSLEYPSWPVMALKTTITENGEASESVRLPHGKLTVESTPAGATVLLDGKSYKQTPLFFDKVSAGIKKLTLQADDFPPLEVTVTVEDRGEAKVGPELGYGFPELDPAALLSAVWVPDDPNKLSPGVDSLGRYEPRNGIVKNLHRKRLYESWLRKSYRFAAVVKVYDPKSGKVEFAEQAGALSKYRVIAELSPAARSDPTLAERTTKGATLILYGRLVAVEESRWPLKVITLEISPAELLH